ncbi:unnamed protein product [Eretmochelys imbricata]
MDGAVRGLVRTGEEAGLLVGTRAARPSDQSPVQESSYQVQRMSQSQGSEQSISWIRTKAIATDPDQAQTSSSTTEMQGGDGRLEFPPGGNGQPSPTRDPDAKMEGCP